MTPRSIYLAGFMGTGKSTIGRLLAAKVRRPFFDLDEEIVRRAGCSIPELFDREGEAGFRVREKACLTELAGRTGIVLATGGGAVLDEENRTLLATSGMLVALLADEETIWARIGTDPNRPLLQGDLARKRIHELLAQRRPVYESLPYSVHTGGLSPEEVVAEIMQLLD